MKKGFDSESICDKKYVKTKVKSYNDEATIFMIKKFLK